MEGVAGYLARRLRPLREAAGYVQTALRRLGGASALPGLADRAQRGALELAPVSRHYLGRPVLVAADLRALHGPATGIATLPLSLHWSGTDAAARFNLDDHRQRPALYATVLREAGEPADLAAWLNADILVELWPRLVLPRAVRAAWEEQHQVLSDARGARQLRHAS